LVDAGANVAVDAARAAQVLDGVDIVGQGALGQHLRVSEAVLVIIIGIIIGAEQRHDVVDDVRRLGALGADQSQFQLLTDRLRSLAPASTRSRQHYWGREHALDLRPRRVQLLGEGGLGDVLLVHPGPKMPGDDSLDGVLGRHLEDPSA
jgi:hypothetical protein